MATMLILLLLFSISDGFNIDVTDTKTFSGEEEEFFGYNVRQYQSNYIKKIIVSAPLAANGSGAVYTCSVGKEECSLLYQPGSEESKHIKMFGMTLALTPSPLPELTSCSPYMTHQCHGNLYLNGICFKFRSPISSFFNISNKFSFPNISSFTTGIQECTKANVKMVFLVDGSASMTGDDFQNNKDFIKAILRTFANTTFQFSAVQFSLTFSTIFTFEDYLNGTAEEKINKEPHMKSLTNTHGAIRYVLTNHFQNVDPEIIKAMIIITDGNPTDSTDGTELKKCDRQNIKRFVLAVGTEVKIESLRDLASEPKLNNTFQIKNYTGLNSFMKKLQNKIFSIEGTGSSMSMTKELSQSGFSAATDQDLLILGAIGSNNWRGTLYDVTESEDGIKEMEIQDSSQTNYSYMGYAVALGRRDGASLVFSGAPRANHKGQVTFFRKMKGTWKTEETISGEQLGSYFGGSVGVLDVNLDNETDFLVVGAPTYHQTHPPREGRMYVYRLGPKLVKLLEVSESVEGQFATTVASIADLNGDKLQDLAVGAPLEDDGRGAVYIYLGNFTQGIRSYYSQRILARTISEELQQFGVSIDGVMDMGQDGLLDIAVGAQGAVVLLKSRPVLSVSAEFYVSPSQISLSNLECLDKEVTLPIMTLTICFSMAEITASTDAANANLNVSYKLDTDPRRKESRVFFRKEDRTSRSLLKSELLESNISCFNHTLYMLNCVRDTLSPVIIHINFYQSDHQLENSSAMMNPDIRTSKYVEIPFQINCLKYSSCVADLQLNFTFQNRSLLVVDHSYFIINVSLSNKGDDSFNTVIVMHYPPGLSLSKFNTIKANRRTLSSCGGHDDEALDKITCSISLPVYRQDTHAEFQGIFHVSRFFDWNTSMEMTLVARSENNNGSNVVVRKSLPVQFAVDVAISPVLESSVSFLNFSKDNQGPKPLRIIYKVRNLGWKGLPVAVSFTMPSQIQQSISLEDHSIKAQNITRCSKQKTKNTTECKNSSCVKFECQFFHLESDMDVLFDLNALATIQIPPQTWISHFRDFRMENVFNVVAELDFDKQHYHQLSDGEESSATRFHRSEISVKVELLIPPNKIVICTTGGMGGLFLLIIITVGLYKCGFFTRKQLAATSSAPEKKPLVTTAKEDTAGDPNNAEQNAGEKAE